MKQTPIGQSTLDAIVKYGDGLKIWRADLRYRDTNDPKGVPSGLPFNDARVQSWGIKDLTTGFARVADNGGEIWLSKSLGNFGAAWTLVHEMTHIKQKPMKSDYDPKNLKPYREERAQRELEAFIVQTEWLLEKQERLTDSVLEECGSFVKKSNGTWVLNKAGIVAHVKKNYLDVIEAEANNKYAATDYAYESNNDIIQVINWGKTNAK